MLTARDTGCPQVEGILADSQALLARMDELQTLFLTVGDVRFWASCVPWPGVFFESWIHAPLSVPCSAIALVLFILSAGMPHLNGSFLLLLPSCYTSKQIKTSSVDLLSKDIGTLAENASKLRALFDKIDGLQVG